MDGFAVLVGSCAATPAKPCEGDTQHCCFWVFRSLEHLETHCRAIVVVLQRREALTSDERRAQVLGFGELRDGVAVRAGARRSSQKAFVSWRTVTFVVNCHGDGWDPCRWADRGVLGDLGTRLRCGPRRGPGRPPVSGILGGGEPRAERDGGDVVVNFVHMQMDLGIL